MKIVSNASPLISLKLIGDLKGGILADNFGITYILNFRYSESCEEQRSNQGSDTRMYTYEAR
jgi:hypothetical protein